MTRYGRVLVALVLGTLIGGWSTSLAAFDGFPPGKWWKNRDLEAKLKLTSAQVTEIDKLFIEDRKRLIDLMAEAEKRELDLESLLQADPPDASKLEAAIDRVNEARASLNKARLLMQVQVWRLLTPEQRQQIRAWQGERRGPERGGRPGPPHKGRHEEPEDRGKKGRADAGAGPLLGALTLDHPRDADPD